MPAKSTASKTTARKVTVKKSSKPAAKTTASKSTAAKKSPAKSVAKKSAAKKTSTWVTQSTVAFDADTAVSRFTTQTQRKMLRSLVSGETLTTTDAKPATLRSIDRLKDLGAVTVAKSGKVAITARGRQIVA